MQETLLTMLQSIIILAVTLVSIYIVKFLAAKTEEAKALTDNDKAKRYISEVSEAVTTAVLHTAQTYVDALKQSDTFDEANQKEALSKVVAAAKQQLSASANEFVESVYGDVNQYLETKIEAEIKAVLGPGHIANF